MGEGVVVLGSVIILGIACEGVLDGAHPPTLPSVVTLSHKLHLPHKIHFPQYVFILFTKCKLANYLFTI